MTLARLSVLVTSLLALLVTALFARIFLDEWRSYRSLDASLVSMEAARQALVVAEKMAFERGPANAVLGEGDVPNPAYRPPLARARADSDASMAALVGYVQAAGRPHDRDALPSLGDASAAIAKARSEIDRLAALPRDARDPAAVRQGLQAMFAVIPHLMDAHARLTRNAADVYRPVSEGMAGARLCAELREYAGQLGSQFTVALTTGRPLAPADHENIGFLRGRLAQLLELVQRPLQRLPDDAPPRRALAAVQQRYFGAGLDFVDSMEERSRQGVPYGYDTATFARRYVPDMQAIVELRDVLVQDARAETRAARERARQRLVVTGSLIAAILLVLAGVVLTLRYRVVRPLLAAAQTLRDIADGQLDRAVPVSNRRDEVGAVQQALSRVRNGALVKRQLEHERTHMIEELKRASLTDPLTGIWNRRAFNETLQDSSRRADARHLPIAVVLFDIDHFKAVNDRYGHDAGDRVLKRVAALSQHLLRQGETVARYGGEEFIVLLAHADTAAAQQVAERLRTGIADARIVLANGQEVRVTASFGVAIAPHAMGDLEPLLRAADPALYAAKAAGRNRTVVATASQPPTDRVAPSGTAPLLADPG